MKMRKTLAFLLMIVFAVTLSACGGPSPQTTTTSGTSTEDKGYKATELRIAIQPAAGFVPIYVVKQNGWLEEALKPLGVTVKWTEFESGPPMNESFAAGEQHLGFIGDVPVCSAIAAGQNNIIVGDAAYNVDGYAVLVPKNSTITSVKDLKGKKIGLKVGSTANNLVQKVLARDGLDINKDVEIADLGPADLQAAFSTNQIAAGAVWEPSITRLTGNGTARVLVNGEGVLKGVNAIFANKTYANENPKIISIALEQYARGAKALRDDPKANTEKIAAAFNLEHDQMVKVVEKYTYPVIFTDEDIQELQNTVTFLVNIDAIAKEFSIKDYIDPKFYQAVDLSPYYK